LAGAEDLHPKPLDDDLAWVLASPQRHAVAFFPRMRPGYRIQKNPTPYALDGTPLAESAAEHFLCDCLQIGGLGANALAFCAGVFDRVPNPRSGNAPRWSLSAPAAPNAPVTVAGVNIDMSVVGTPGDNMWAVAWSHN
jgi:hypothetical protein